MDFSLPIGPFIEMGSRVLKLSAVSASRSVITERLRKSICKFQLNYSNYFFTASRSHKLFKEAKSSKKQQRYNEMIELLESGLKSSIGGIAEQIQKYFTCTHSSIKAPRIGIHFVTDENYVVDVIQFPSVNGGAPFKEIHDYSVFQDVINGGIPYLDNNIPQTIKKRADYKHRGINLNKVIQEYKLPFTDRKPLSRWINNILKVSTNDNDWARMRMGTGIGYDSLYKSHLVIPITYRRHAEMAQLSREMIEVLQLEGEGRSILGFLFVDHPSTYYFDDDPADCFENIDINSLVIFADMISMVIVTKLMYTVGSETVTDYCSN